MSGNGPEIRSSPYANAINNYGSSIITLTSADPELYEVELKLRGLDINEKGEKEVIMDPLLTEEGINKILMLIRPIISRNTHMTNYNQHTVDALMLKFADRLNRILMFGKSLGIKNVYDRDIIAEICEDFVYASFNRGKDEGDKRFLKNATQEITTRVENSGGSKRGLLGSVLGWGK